MSLFSRTFVVYFKNRRCYAPPEMNTYSDPSPIATIEQFKKALIAVRDAGLPPAYLAMLRAQCQSPNQTITSTRLAEAAGYKNYNAANLHYGTIGRLLAERLGYTPDKRTDGSERWWRTLSSGRDGSQETDEGHFEFIMRPELVAALTDMRWA